MKSTQKTKRAPWSKRRKLVTVLLGILAVLLVWIIGSVLYQVIVNGEYYEMRYGTQVRTQERHFEYSEPNFAENIFEDAVYMRKNRDIKYIYGAQSTEISLDEDASYYGDRFVFFQNYFNAVVNGDYVNYPSFFFPEYAKDKNNLPLPEEPFTMQKVYNISLDFRSGYTEKVSDTEYKYYYVVKYSLLENNGTFRPDLEPETTVALLFELTEKGDDLGITKILHYIE